MKFTNYNKPIISKFLNRILIIKYFELNIENQKEGKDEKRQKTNREFKKEKHEKKEKIHDQRTA